MATKAFKKRFAGLMAAVVTITSMGSFAVNASAASSITYSNASGYDVAMTSYKHIDSGTTKLSGGYFYVSGTTVLTKRLKVTRDSAIVLGSGCTFICQKGIDVADGVRLNIYTQGGKTGKLYAGIDKNGNTTISSGYCGIGGYGATVNILGGQIYAKGGSGAYGIEGSSINLYHTNKSDYVQASSYSRSVNLAEGFVDKKSGKVYYGNTARPSDINNVRLDGAEVIQDTTRKIRNNEYIVLQRVNLDSRLYAEGDVDIYLTDSAELNAYAGIDVDKGTTLSVYGEYGKLSAGTRDYGHVAYTDRYQPGIGASENQYTGEIIINGGIVSAAGGKYAAGIGGNGATVRINGGEVYASGGEYAAAIGSNYNDKGSDVKITGGKVTATANVAGNSYGIGSGYNSGKSYISLGLSSPDDFITSTTYNGTVSFSKTLYTSDYKTAYQSNIAGKTLKLQNDRVNAAIYYDTNGAGRVSSKTTYTGNKVGTLPSVYKYGYVLEGWYSEPTFTTRVTADTIVTGDMTLYAKWIPAYNYGYWNYYNGYDWDYYNNYDYWNNYYNYWDYYDPNYWDPYYYGNNYYDYWNDYYNYNYYNYYNYRTVSFDTDGAGTIEPIRVPYGKGILRLPYVIKNGYVFDGWYTDKNYYNRFDADTPVYSDMTLYAKWIPSNYYIRSCNVDFVTNGANTVGRRTVEYGKTLGTMPYVEKSGYIFDGWYLDENFTYRVNENTPIYGDMTFYAKWVRTADIATCQIYFDAGYGWFADGSVIITKNIRTGGRASEVFPVNPVYSGGYGRYEFVGWYYDREFTRPYNNEPVYSNMMLYAKYELR